MKLAAENWRSLSQLLDEALALPLADRAAWVATLAAEHAPLKPLLEELFARPAAVSTADLVGTLPFFALREREAGRAARTIVGPYRLIREIGRGGMGAVWLAERADGLVKRAVALKLPVLAASRAALAERFAREREILSPLAHPHIARLYDAGFADDGQPYLALEYVADEPATSYCERAKLSVAKRLELFLQVLAAAQYAHANLVLHRDLKPSNILVTPEGDVKLLDFGIAKLMTDGATQDTALTQIAGRALTPDYAAPEQISGAPLTTASDVYSLGVVLYELLAGVPPYRLKRGSKAEIEEAILTQDIARPSAAVTSDVAAKRATTSRKLKRLLSGDLDTIVLKALAKAPAARYPSAEAFASDIARYLHGDPVLARRPSRARIALRFLRRHVLASTLVSAFTLALAATSVVALLKAHEETLQRERADTIGDFLRNVFTQNDPQQSEGAKLTAAELLSRSGQRLEKEFRGDPYTKALLLTEIGGVYIGLGLPAEARPYTTHAVELLDPMRERYPEDYLAAVSLVAESLTEGAAHAEAVAWIDGHLPFALSHRTRDSTWVGRLLDRRGWAKSQLGDSEGAERDLRQALADLEAAKAQKTVHYANALTDLGVLFLNRGDSPRALATFQQAIVIQQSAAGVLKIDPLVNQLNIARAYFNLREIDETIRVLEPVIGRMDALIGPGYDRTIKARNLLAQAYALRGDLDKAIAVVDVNIDALRRQPGADDENVRVSELTKAKFALYAHRLDVAEALAAPGVAYLVQKYPGLNNLKTRARWILGETLVQSHRCREAGPVLEIALAETRSEVGGSPSTYVAEILDSLARCALQQGDPRRARALLAEALENNRGSLGPSKPSTLRSEIHLAWADILLTRDRATLLDLAGRRDALIAALGSDRHPDLWQFDLLTDSLAAAMHTPRIDPARRKSAEEGLGRLSETPSVPSFVGLNSLS
ncbi:MAG TPA: protein kinase [Casimicrobiaceae bacterium]|nr:protein kinase [Casimicrobiaceae bacterium]